MKRDFIAQNNRQRMQRQLDREEGEVGTDRCIQHRAIDRQKDSQIERKGRQVHNIEQQIDRQREFIAQNNRQSMQRQLDREEGEVGTDKCIQHRTIDRQRDSQIERRKR